MARRDLTVTVTRPWPKRDARHTQHQPFGFGRARLGEGAHHARRCRGPRGSAKSPHAVLAQGTRRRQRSAPIELRHIGARGSERAHDMAVSAYTTERAIVSHRRCRDRRWDEEA